REPHFFSCPEDATAARLDAHVAELKLAAPGPWPGPAQHRADPGEQLSQREGLGHVVVGAQLEAEYAIHLLSARGEHDDRHLDAATAELTAYVPARQLRHHDV